VEVALIYDTTHLHQQKGKKLITLIKWQMSIGKTPNTEGNTSSKLETKLLEKNQKEMKGGKKKLEVNNIFHAKDYHCPTT
jgi:hypothetical protein